MSVLNLQTPHDFASGTAQDRAHSNQTGQSPEVEEKWQDAKLKWQQFAAGMRIPSQREIDQLMRTQYKQEKK